MRNVRDYRQEEMATIDSGIKLVFARDDVRPDQDDPYRVRFHDMLEAFTIYPRNDRDLAVNELIWHAVKNSSFQSCHWPSRTAAANVDQGGEYRNTQSRIFALGIPEQLVNYLQNVTLPEMYESILCILADAARSEDGEGLTIMRKELAPSVWRNLEKLLVEGESRLRRMQRLRTPAAAFTASAGSRRRPVEDTSPMTAEAGESLPSVGKTNPSSSTRLQEDQESCLYASYLLDQALHFAQDQDYWQIAITGATFEPAGVLATEMHDSDQAVVIHSLYNDWRMYAKNCMISSPPAPAATAARGTKRPASPLTPALGPGGMLQFEAPTTANRRRTRIDRKQVLTTMMKRVQEQRQEDTWKRTATVLSCAERSDSYLASLPDHIVKHCILPQIVLEQCCPGPAKKSVSIFQTLDMRPSGQPE